METKIYFFTAIAALITAVILGIVSYRRQKKINSLTEEVSFMRNLSDGVLCEANINRLSNTVLRTNLPRIQVHFEKEIELAANKALAIDELLLFLERLGESENKRVLDDQLVRIMAKFPMFALAEISAAYSIEAHLLKSGGFQADPPVGDLIARALRRYHNFSDIEIFLKKFEEEVEAFAATENLPSFFKGTRENMKNLAKTEAVKMRQKFLNH